METILSAVRRLAEQQPLSEAVDGDHEAIILEYLVGATRLVVRYDTTHHVAIYPVESVGPGWWLDTGCWEFTTRVLAELVDASELSASTEVGSIPPSRYHAVDEAMTRFRQHLESNAWLVRLLLELGREIDS